MKKLLIALAMLVSAASALAQNVSINIGQPGFYGRIELGDFRAPPVYYTEPMVIQRGARYAPEPLYLRVPPGHMKKWGKHCSRYNACNRQVFFVRDEWYTNTYAPRYRETRGWRGDGHRDRDNNHGRDQRGGTVYFDSNDDGRGKHNGKHDKHEKRDNKHDNKGHGRGHGKD